MTAAARRKLIRWRNRFPAVRPIDALLAVALVVVTAVIYGFFAYPDPFYVQWYPMDGWTQW